MDHTDSRINPPAIQAISATAPVAPALMTDPINRRRLASPIRLTLASELGGALDGAWWPHTSSVARELSELDRRPRERWAKSSISASTGRPLEGVPDLDSLHRRGNAAIPGREARQQRVMTVTGSRARARLLVVPCRDHHSPRCHAAASSRCATHPVHAPGHRGVPDRRRYRPRRARRTADECGICGWLSLKRCADGRHGCDVECARNWRLPPPRASTTAGSARLRDGGVRGRVIRGAGAWNGATSPTSAVTWR